ncbi:MAG: hypothetical protein ABIJ96_11980 [Elusimicrobiota bacterium]
MQLIDFVKPLTLPQSLIQFLWQSGHNPKHHEPDQVEEQFFLSRQYAFLRERDQFALAFQGEFTALLDNPPIGVKQNLAQQNRLSRARQRR